MPITHFGWLNLHMKNVFELSSDSLSIGGWMRKKTNFHWTTLVRLSVFNHILLFHFWSHEIATTVFVNKLLDRSYLALCCNDAFILQSFSHSINRYFDKANKTRHQVEHARATKSRTNKMEIKNVNKTRSMLLQMN